MINKFKIFICKAFFKRTNKRLSEILLENKFIQFGKGEDCIYYKGGKYFFIVRIFDNKTRILWDYNNKNSISTSITLYDDIPFINIHKVFKSSFFESNSELKIKSRKVKLSKI